MSHPETLALHGGSWRADPASGAVAVPIYQTTSYQFRDTGHARRLFALEELGYTYTRTINPGREVLERRLTALEGGKAALALASGAAALLYSVLDLAEAGDSVVVSARFAVDHGAGLIQTLLRLGVDVRVVEHAAAEEFTAATGPRTRLWLADSVAGPDLEVFPVAAVAEAGRRLNVPLVVDNSRAPLSLRPLAEGAAVAVYDLAGPLGTGTAQGGIIVDGGGFDWAADPERLPSLNRPDPSYHGTVWTQVVRQWNASAFIASARGRFLRDLGSAISPFDVTLAIQALETLPLRARHRAAAAAFLAGELSRHPAVAAVHGPVGGLLAVHLRWPERAADVAGHLCLLSGGGSRGAVRVQDGTLVIAAGLEHAEDALADLRRALDHVRHSVAPGPPAAP